jgi:hypothetical protein
MLMVTMRWEMRRRLSCEKLFVTLLRSHAHDCLAMALVDMVLCYSIDYC